MGSLILTDHDCLAGFPIIGATSEYRVPQIESTPFGDIQDGAGHALTLLF